VPSARLIAWGAIGGVVAGVLLLIGNVLALFATEGDGLAVTGSWLVLIAFVATVFLAIGVHEVLRDRNVSLDAVGTVLLIIGAVLLAAISYVALGASYGGIEDPFYLDKEVIGVIGAGSGAFGLGVILSGVAIIRAGVPLPSLAGVLMLVAAAAFLIGIAVTVVYYIGAMVLGIAFAWIGAVLWQERQRVDTT
jgi:hypothetical protein